MWGKICAGKTQRISELELNGLTRRIWRMQDGLPDDVISALAETPEQYLRIGTPQSLIRFDGYHFTNVSAETSPEIRDFGVTCLFAARDGSLWIGTGGGTLMRMRGTAVQAYGEQNRLREFNVRALQEDAAGAIWARTDHGICHLVQERLLCVPHIGDP